LVLADTRAESDTAEGRANRDKMIDQVHEKGSAAVINTMLPKLLGNKARPRIEADVRALGAKQSTGGVVGGLEALRDRPDALPWLASINVPTLVLVGADDVLTPPSMAQTLAQGIPGARLVTIESAGHLSNWEEPEAFNAAVRSFLRSLP
jgi:pimeloyl-ACP methyl ester carboxylesterase